MHKNALFCLICVFCVSLPWKKTSCGKLKVAVAVAVAAEEAVVLMAVVVKNEKKVENLEWCRNFRCFFVFVSSSSLSMMSKTLSLRFLFFSYHAPASSPAAAAVEVAAEVVLKVAAVNSRHSNRYFPVSGSFPIDMFAWHFFEQVFVKAAAATAEEAVLQVAVVNFQHSNRYFPVYQSEVVAWHFFEQLFEKALVASESVKAAAAQWQLQ